MTELHKLLTLTLRRAAVFLRGKGLGQLPLVTRIYSFLYRHFRPSGIVLIDVQGIKMQVDSRDTGVVPSLLRWGFYEKYGTELFEKLIRKGMVVVDIGANIGYHTLLAARLVGVEGKVFAFEPDPHNYCLLCKNIEVNGYRNVIAIRKAVSNKSGKVKLFLDKNNLGAHSLLEANVIHLSGMSVVVDVTSLDEFFRNKDYRIDIIKIDVEGSEMEVLEGMSNTINRNANLKVITEFWPLGLQRSGSSPTEFLNKLIGYGFALYHIGQYVESVSVNDILRMCSGKEHINLLCIKR